MIEFIILIIFIISLGGLLFILNRKISVLNGLSENGSSGIEKHKFIIGIEEKIKEFRAIFRKKFSLHKILSWVKIITMKIEVMIDYWLHKARKNAQKK